MNISGDQYLTQVYDDTYLLVDKVEINTEHFEQNSSNFQKYEISVDTILEMQEAIAKEKENENDDFAISLYATTEPTPYQYRNNWFKDVIVEYRNSSIAPTSITGSGTKTTASNIINLVVSIVGLSNSYVSIFGASMSALDLYESTKGPVVYGTQNDWCYVSLFYDKLVKKTYEQTFGSTWELGCTSQKVWIERSSTHQYYASVGSESLLSRNINRSFFTESWDYAARVAMYNLTSPKVDSPIQVTVNNVTMVF